MNDQDLRTLMTRRADALDTAQPDRLPQLRARIRAAQRRRTAGTVATGVLAVAVATTVVLVAGDPDRRAQDPVGPVSPTPSAAYQEVPEGGSGNDRGLEPGRWALHADGSSADTVLAVLDVPAGYDGTTWFIGSDVLAVGYWLVQEVPRDPCQETGRKDPGPSVADLVRALDRQRLTTVVNQAPVTVGGYDGTYLEIIAPDLDYSSCQEGEVFYWETPKNGARHHEGPAGAVEHVWVLDVEGQRVVISGNLAPGAPDGAAADLEDLVESVRFVEPDAG